MADISREVEVILNDLLGWRDDKVYLTQREAQDKLLALIDSVANEARVAASEGQLWLVLRKARNTDYKDMGIFEAWLEQKHSEYKDRLKELKQSKEEL